MFLHFPPRPRHWFKYSLVISSQIIVLYRGSLLVEATLLLMLSLVDSAKFSWRAKAASTLDTIAIVVIRLDLIEYFGNRIASVF